MCHWFTTIHNHGFSGPMRSLKAIVSIDNNQNIALDKVTYSLVIETCSYTMASDVTSLYLVMPFDDAKLVI